MQVGRRYGEREVEEERNVRDRYLRRNKTEAIVVHKRKQVESYAEILRKMKGNINIEEIGSEETRIRRTATGSLLIQIAGEESKRKADVLAERMREVVGQKAKVGRPCKKAEIRISGIDEDTIVEDVVAAVAKYGECDIMDIKAGGIRRNRQGEGDIWVRCPWNSAAELAKRRRIRIGWVRARVEIMEPPLLQCFRCWEYGQDSPTVRQCYLTDLLA